MISFNLFNLCFCFLGYRWKFLKTKVKTAEFVIYAEKMSQLKSMTCYLRRLICFSPHNTRYVQRMMAHPFFFVLACLWQSQSVYSNTIEVVIVRQEIFGNNNLSRYVFFQNINDGLSFNFTVLQEGEESYQEMLDRFCTIAENTGVSAIISEDRSSHPKLLDVYASYMGIPLIKLFQSDYEKQLVIKQVRYCVIFVSKVKAGGKYI